MSTAATTNTLHRHHNYHHHHRTLQHHLLLNRHRHTSLPLLKPTITFSLSSSSSATSTTAVSAAAITTASAAAGTISFDALHLHLSTQNFREADEETRRLLIQLAGEAAVNRGYVFFSEVKFISDSDLKTIDTLWKTHSNNRFGYSVQRKIWKKSNRDFTKLFIKLGWMKKLDTEMEQYNYKAFPEEFIWELKDDTPEGHLPLTNALRGTQLFTCILSHPAFDEEDEEEGKGAGEEEDGNGGVKKQSMNSNRVFKTDYSF